MLNPELFYFINLINYFLYLSYYIHKYANSGRDPTHSLSDYSSFNSEIETEVGDFVSNEITKSLFEKGPVTGSDPAPAGRQGEVGPSTGNEPAPVSSSEFAPAGLQDQVAPVSMLNATPAD